MQLLEGHINLSQDRPLEVPIYDFFLSFRISDATEKISVITIICGKSEMQSFFVYEHIGSEL